MSDLHRVPGKSRETKLEVKLGGSLYLLTFNECLLFKRSGGFIANELRKRNKEILMFELCQQKRRRSK